ncbi:MAG TPA: hypothetical protein VHC22_22580 [Pirellulales bacterium]|nr:hypothetical protein [Pirellulales bacterium]
MTRRFQFSVRALLLLVLLAAALCALAPPVYELLFPTPNVVSYTTVVDQGVRYYHLVWSNRVEMRVPADTPGMEAYNGRGRWRAPASTQAPGTKDE